MIKSIAPKQKESYVSPLTEVLTTGLSCMVCGSLDGEATIDDFTIDPIVDVDWLL